MKIFSSPTTRFLPYLTIGLLALNACSHSPQRSSAPTPQTEVSSPASSSPAPAPTGTPKVVTPSPTAESSTASGSAPTPASSSSAPKTDEDTRHAPTSSAPAQEQVPSPELTQQPQVIEYSEPPVPRGTVITVPPEPPVATEPHRESKTTPEASHPEPVVPAPASTAPMTASTPVCDYGNIRIDAQAAPGAGAAGSRYISLTFSNTGTAPCSLSGYPGVNYVDANGHQIGASAVPAGEWTSSGKVLHSHESVTAILRETRAGLYSEQMCQPTTAAGYRVIIPGTSNSLVLKFPAEACSDNTVTQLSIGQVGAGSS
ncbi:DUF4232 domain-containing protein [Rothia sp. CCM 9419]|uniref:DUF4232 domain-containing protein n=1 Tax=Rothia sp. CCM 9419 TaxID=3402662 RepID=UPI003ADAE37B